jgi:phosphonate transport system substrate-binding protein
MATTIQISRFISFLTILLCGVIVGSTGAEDTPSRDQVKTISLGIVAEINQNEIAAHFRPFVHYVAQKLSPGSGFEGTVILAPTPLQLAKLIEEKKVDFYMESPYATYVINKQGAAVLIVRRWKSGMAEYRSLIITNRGSKMDRLEDLRGKIIAFEDPGSTSGYFLPKILLLKKGFKLVEKRSPEAKVAPKEIGYFFASSAANIVDLVFSKRLAAGAISNDDYSSIDEKKRAEISILAQTDSFPRHLVSTRKDLDPKIKNRLKEILLTMHQNEEGRKILQQTDSTAKFDLLPGGEELVRRKLVELFRGR